MVGSQIINLFGCFFQSYTLQVASLVCSLLVTPICSFESFAKQQPWMFIIQIVFTKDFKFNVILTQSNCP